MNRTFLMSALLAAFVMTACDKPTVVAVPVPMATPGPAGPAGATGATGSQGSMGTQGNDGNTGAAGKPGEGTTVIVMPAASAPAN